MCLKLYCECFAAGRMCNIPCVCFSCKNNEPNSEYRQEVMKQIKQRNPSAFEAKINLKAEIPGKNGIIERHKKGCNCSKSGC